MGLRIFCRVWLADAENGAVCWDQTDECALKSEKTKGWHISVEEKLFSVVILCYRHFEYLFSTIDSVLAQNYPQIELIISDDGSKNFPKGELERYLTAKRKTNIKYVQIRQEKENVGTVKHLNHVLPLCKGDFIVALAGDDALFDECVLSKYVEGFSSAPEDCLIQMAQTAMFDEKLSTIESFYVGPIVRKAIERTKESTDELLRLLISEGACLPSTSTCFKREFFERFGKFDESYVLIEDYPMHVRLAEEGWVIHYNNFIAIKHRHGGISHGQHGALPASQLLYFIDMRKAIEEIILKRLDLLSGEEKKRVQLHQKRELRWLDFALKQVDKDAGVIFPAMIRYPLFSCENLLRKLWVWAYVWHIKALVYFLLLRLFTPAILDMAETVLGLSVRFTQPVSYIAAILWLAIWIAAFVIWGLNKLLWMIQRFPQEVIAIG